MSSALKLESVTLVDLVQKDISADDKTLIDKIDAYPFEKVKEKIRSEESIPEGKIDEAVLEFKKFLVLLGLGYRKLGMTSPVVDEVWHTFILFTRDYANFCQDVFGFFVHHTPDTKLDPIDLDSGSRFFEAYSEVFGDIPEIWGTSNDCEDCVPTTNCQDGPSGCDSSNCHGW